MSTTFISNVDESALANSYIVLLKEDVVASTDAHLDQIRNEFSVAAAAGDSVPGSDLPFQVGTKYDNIKAYSATLTDSALQALKENSDVEHIVKNTLVHTCVNTQDDAPWGLQRISQQLPLRYRSNTADLSYHYTWDAAQQKVDVYVVDTGVFIQHTEFQGRARWGKTFGGYADADGNGHGTHVAGTIAGARVGIAKNANIIAVKVLGDNGSGPTTDILAGLRWVEQEAARTQNPSVINMSLGGTANLAMDRAVKSAVEKGIHVCVAAGNDGRNASNSSPARAGQNSAVITVGATNIRDQLAIFSNFGDCLHISAPGEDIISASLASPTAYRSLSGTSMATPHVAGALARSLALGGNKNPAAAAQALEGESIAVLGFLPENTPNRLLQI